MKSGGRSALRFLSHEEIRDRTASATWRVMLFLPKGQYPKVTLYTANGLFHADDDLVFSVVRSESWQLLVPEGSYSEFDWAFPQELRLLVAMLLCETRDGPLIRFYPVVRFSPVLALDEPDFSNPGFVQDVKELLLQAAKKPRSNHSDNVIKKCIEGKYCLIESEQYAFERFNTFWNKIDVRNYVLMRGVYALIKAEMLACHRAFWEEAIIISYISLEATFQLVIRALEKAGVKNPNSKDASVWLHENFDKAFGHSEPLTEKYFEEFYEDRIRTLHPSSRFGETPYAPIMHDDFVHLRRSLREIFAFLVSNEHGQDFHEEVKHFHSHNINQKNST